MEARTYTVAEFLGDGISEELSQSVRSVLEALPFQVALHSVDLSLENRDERGQAIFDEAVDAIHSFRTALKYPTTTRGESPNKVLRERCDFSVIHRPVASIPGIQTHWTGQLDLDIVRVATGGTYEDAGRRIGKYSAVSIRVIEWIPCLHACRYAFRLANRRGRSVTSASKYTIQRQTDGLFEEVASKVAREYPGVPYRKELFDALLGHVVMTPERYGVVVLPNEYGDFLSDAACGLIGSIGLGDSASFSFTEDGETELAMFDPAGGTAPDIAGRDLANPSAMLFALSSMLRHLGEDAAAEALRGAVLRCVAEGETTRDIGGTLGTRAFTQRVVERMQAALASPP